jgi:hypothetical protein
LTAANKPPTRSAAATASGMMTRAGWAFARLACPTFPPKDSPVPLTYSKIRGRANCQLPCETVSSEMVSSGTEVGMAQLRVPPLPTRAIGPVAFKNVSALRDRSTSGVCCGRKEYGRAARGLRHLRRQGASL